MRISVDNIFLGVNHSLRTDEEYVRCLDEDHHKDDKSPLSALPTGMVSQVPFEYMHLVLLGVMKKLFSAWVYGKYSHLSKLSARSISVISTRLEALAEYCPSDFARRPKSLATCTKYKATEYRQFLLYTGPVVTHGILYPLAYTHFLFLHAAIRISFCSAIKSTPLDTFSAFPYENNMSVFRKYCRKSDLCLQQIYNRFAEIEAHSTIENRSMNSFTHVSIQHNAGLLPSNLLSNLLRHLSNGRKLIPIPNITLNMRDNCCILHDMSVCILINIIMIENSYYLILKRFLEVKNFYDVGISSLALHIFKCSSLSNSIITVGIEEVCLKGYRMPF
ncbi:hypothetical protein ALC57_07595 [Trachymyrmex cornetzi]|uniref:Uncharacterized protein n=1 Tax=Trachymyrmex cornetzi TaxID=471704 RepID=A0A151J7Y6_9HYME|nr:hypothetical protein ALC57_07595 [Trachymyrmex cornetzi]